jgi:hypothetical protein
MRDCWLVVTTPLQTAGKIEVARSTTNGGAPPIQLKLTFAPAGEIVSAIEEVTVSTTAS